MMDERLKEILELEGYAGFGGYAVYFKGKKQFDWLKEQAKRVRELEEVIHLYKLRKENAQELNEIVLKPLKEENQRYKEALQEVRDCIEMFYDNGNPRRIRPELSSIAGFINVMDSTCTRLLKGES